VSTHGRPFYISKIIIMNVRPIVMKFGGTSVEDADAFARVAGIVQAQSSIAPVIVVVSAMSRFTDALLASVRLAAEGNVESAHHDLSKHFERHLVVARKILKAEAITAIELVVKSAQHEIVELLRQVEEQPSNKPALQDEIVSYGESLSATLLATVINDSGPVAQYVDARRCIITDNDHGRATPLKETEARTRTELEPLINRRTIPVLGGFIGSTIAGATTTLGRGGSDYTAALVGAAISAREIQIWTDVTGVLTADPRVVRDATTIPRLSYQEAAELAYFGAKVLHPKTIQPAVEKHIPVRICNSRIPSEIGTIVSAESETSPNVIKAIAHKTGITTIKISSARMLGAYGFLRILLEVFDRHRTAVDIVTTSEVSVTLSLDDTSSLLDITGELKQFGQVEVEHNRAIICVVGEGMHSTPGIAARIFSTLPDINILLISLGASNNNLTFVVDEKHVEEVVRRLHSAFFES
jgi:aspartate kinase